MSQYSEGGRGGAGAGNLNVWTAVWKMLPSVHDLLELSRNDHDLLGPFYFINLYPDAVDL